MKYRPIKLAIVVMSMLISFGSFAQGPPGGSHGGKQGGGPNKGEKPDASEILKLLDINSDGKIDKDEASKDEREKIAEDFEITDSNEDGYIDIEELEASLDSSKPKKISVKALLKAVDQNEDGQLNELEVAAKDKRDLMDKFKEIDTNGDSQLNLEELKVFYENYADNKRRK